MIDSIGSLINQIPSLIIVFIIVIATVLLLVVNYKGNLRVILTHQIERIKILRTKTKPAELHLTPKQIEELSNSLVGKFMNEDLVDGKETIAVKGTLISEQIAFEAEKRGLLQKLKSISAFWPVEN